MRLLHVVNLGQAGPAPSIGHQWWTHHIANTRAYAEAALSGNTPAAVAAVRELWQAVLDWQKLTGSDVAGVLMGEHTVYAKLLVDCFAQESGADCTGTAVDAVVRNVGAQREFFPVEPDRFADLFEVHATLAGQYITDLAQKDMASFNLHFLEALSNGRELAAFTDQILAAPLRRGLSGSRLRRLGQGNYIPSSDFNAYAAQANSSIRKIADIARTYDLSPDDEQTVNSEAGKVTGFTVPMAQVPKCDEGPSLLPLAAAGLLGLLVGSVA